MELETRIGLSEVKKRWGEFWAGENSGPLIAATVPKPGVEPIEKPSYGSGHEGDFGPVVDQIMGWLDSHEFLGDAIPYYYVEFAADHCSALLGADLIFPDPNQGGWPVHFVEDWGAQEIRFHREGKWWERTAAFTEAIKKKGEGRLLLCSPTLVANLDALVAVAGAEKVLTDLADDPNSVLEALRQVTDAQKEILEAFAELFDYGTYGSINRHGMWCEGKINVAQSDFSCMISEQMFEEFAYPFIKEEVESFDHAEYHLDGPDAIRHLPKLCSIEGLDIIQWVAGAGEAQTQDWTWLYERVDSLGKGQILGGSPERIRQLWNLLVSKKLFFGVHGLSDDLEAQRAAVASLQGMTKTTV